MLKEDQKLIIKAAELLSKGIDITQIPREDFDKYVSTVTGKLITKATDTFVIYLKDDVSTILETFPSAVYVRDKGKYYLAIKDGLSDEEKAATSIELDRDNLIALMNIIGLQRNFTDFEGIPKKWYDLDYTKRVKESESSYDKTAPVECPMQTALTKDKTRKNFNALVGLCQYPTEVAQGMLRAFNEEVTDFEIDALRGCTIKDNRLYIPVSLAQLDTIIGDETNTNELHGLKYIVVSRNPYDYYFSSYGSSIQTCYALSSEYLGWYGFFPLSQFKGSYMIYGTTGKDYSQSLISGEKWKIPNVLFRSWGWLTDDNKLMFDKIYMPSATEHLRMKCEKVLSQLFGIDLNDRSDRWTTLKYSDLYKDYYRTYRLSFYPDSVYFTASDGDDRNEYKFKLLTGNRCKIGRNGWQGRKYLSGLLKDLTGISDTYDPCKVSTITNGILCNPKYCPITNLPISEQEDRHELAKLFKEPVGEGVNVAVATYIDGLFKLDSCSFSTNLHGSNLTIYPEEGNNSNKSGSTYYLAPQFSYSKIALKTFKEQLKGAVGNTTCLAYLILRVVEGDKVTFIKYRGK